MSKNTHTSRHNGFMDRMLHPGHHRNEHEQHEQHEQQEKYEPHEQQPEGQSDQGAPLQLRIKKGERERVEEYVDEERKLLQEGDTYGGLM